MRKLHVALLVLLASCITLQAADNEINLTGKWFGELNVGAFKLRLGLEIKQDQDVLEARLFSFDQGGLPLPVEDVKLSGTEFSFKKDQIKASYKGTLNATADEIRGTFTQNGTPLPLTLKKVAAFPKRSRPQTPKPPFSYESMEVQYENPVSGGKLSGTLTLPADMGDLPVALLITGSGAQDRDETIMGHKPFWVIADFLTRQGIAVLRVDDRGVGGSDKGSSADTTADLVTDVQAGVEFLKKHPRINKRQIWLIGHSEGGMIAPMVAAADKMIAGIVCLAGPGVMGRDLLVQQNRLIRSAAGVDDATLDWFMPLFAESLDLVLEKSPDSEEKEFTQKREALVAEHMKTAPILIKLAAGQIQKEVEAIVKQLDVPWMRFFLTLDPQPYLRRTRCPVFGLFGENDLQVPPVQSAEPFEQALEKGRCRDFQVKTYPELNHLLQHSQTGAPSEYGTIEETISSEVLQDITRFIQQRIK